MATRMLMLVVVEDNLGTDGGTRLICGHSGRLHFRCRQGRWRAKVINNNLFFSKLCCCCCWRLLVVFGYSQSRRGLSAVVCSCLWCCDRRRRRRREYLTGALLYIEEIGNDRVGRFCTAAAAAIIIPLDDIVLARHIITRLKVSGGGILPFLLPLIILPFLHSRCTRG